MWIGFILRFRYIASIVVVVLLVHSVGLLALGVYRGYEAYHLLFSGEPWTGTDRPGIHIAESVDSLLFALVLLVLASGTASLFLSPVGGGPDARLPGWMRIGSISELKALLWEAILVVLVVATLTSILANMDQLHWGVLVLPAAILMLSLAFFLARKAGPEHRND